MGMPRVSGAITESGIICASPCLYYGFTAQPDSADRLVRAWDNSSEAAGKLVEDFICDGSKKTDGHERANPVYCENGLYFGADGFRVMVFYRELPLQA